MAVQGLNQNRVKSFPRALWGPRASAETDGLANTKTLPAKDALSGVRGYGVASREELIAETAARGGRAGRDWRTAYYLILRPGWGKG
jgi:hypothetical protein